MTEQLDPARFDDSYRDERRTRGARTATPWDIGRPQPVVEELVAHGALRGKVLDPGTGPGYHAILYASRGFSVTAVDSSPAAIELARGNAEAAGVKVNFELADATELAGFEDRFDTVVDSAFYHVFAHDEETQGRYARTLHRATRPGARWYLFEFGRHNINGLTLPLGLPEENFRRVLPAAGWEINYLGPSSYLANLSVAALQGTPGHHPADNPGVRTLVNQLEILEPLLGDNSVHVPVWAVHATRVD
jgi:SAM-dependent methyltransferase